MKQIIDSVFGLLTFQSGAGAVGWWKKQEYLEVMDGPVPLEIHAEADGPMEEQRQVYQAFRQAGNNVKAEIQDALFEFYKIEREEYADICGDIEGYIEEFLPVLQNSDEIWNILTPLSWRIVGPESTFVQYEEANGEYDTKLSWHGSWDAEHEFSALFQGGRFLGVEHLGCFYGPLELQPSPE